VKNERIDFVLVDVSIEVRPQSQSGGKHLTEDEENEYRQVQDLFWSDPDPHGRLGCRKNDARKMACFFGPDVSEEFLKKYNLSMIIRSHQVKQEGYEFTHDRKVLTVFSASNYCGGSNWGAIIRWFVL
jgi:serine/threonine-protein phosphatase with EF-hand domain